MQSQNHIRESGLASLGGSMATMTGTKATKKATITPNPTQAQRLL